MSDPHAHIPDSVVPTFFNSVPPFFNLVPGLYWTSDVDPNGGGEVTFSFNTGDKGSNTTKYNFFHVLPMTKAVLPGVDDLQQLRDDLGLPAGDVRLEWFGSAGPFRHFQPGFYWPCERDQPGDRRAPCGPNHPGFAPGPNMTPMEWGFNFDDGFQGTDKNDKQFYVMVYFPAG